MFTNNYLAYQISTLRYLNYNIKQKYKIRLALILAKPYILFPYSSSIPSR